MAREARDVVLYKDAARALAEAKTVTEALEFRNRAAGWESLLRGQPGRVRDYRIAVEARLRGERRIGEFLAETVRPGGSPEALSLGVTKLPEGITRNQSSKWQRLASMDAAIFEAGLAEPEPTTASLLQRWKRAQSPRRSNISYETCTVEDLEVLVSNGYQFGTIYADPPWKYGNQGTRASTGNHYTTLTVPEIAALPVEKLAADESHLHLWTTNAFLRDAFDVVKEWGFEYKSCFVWVKPQMGIGNYWRVSHEFMLLGVRGGCEFRDRGLMSWLEARRGEHSTKPSQVRELVERASPGPRLELFGRAAAEGWCVWGNEVSRDLLTHAVRTIK